MMTRCRDSWGPKLLGGFLLILCLCVPLGAQESRKLLKQVEPDYPRVLKKMEIGGTVRLKVVIKADGTVQSTDVLGGNPILATEAQKAVAQWKFAPGPTATTLEVKLLFDPHK
jgi:TonB family protein